MTAAPKTSTWRQLGSYYERIGTARAPDLLVYHHDPRRWCWSAFKSGTNVVIESASGLSTAQSAMQAADGWLKDYKEGE